MITENLEKIKLLKNFLKKPTNRWKNQRALAVKLLL
jgi:hypothetical protein